MLFAQGRHREGGYQDAGGVGGASRNFLKMFFWSRPRALTPVVTALYTHVSIVKLNFSFRWKATK